jgi:hypothetical protein
MQIQRDTPRVYSKRTLLYSLEKAQLRKVNDDLLFFFLVKEFMERRLQRWQALVADTPAAQQALVIGHYMRSRRRMRALLGLAALLQANHTLATLPYLRSVSMGPLKTPNDFDHVQFVEQFRFRKQHFYQILTSLRDDSGQYMMQDGEPIQLKFGQKRHTIYARADSALMVVLRRLAFPARWCDLQFVLGGSRSTLSATFNFMIDLLYRRYSRMATEVDPWKHHFRRFAEKLTDWGCPHTNLIGFFDGHLLVTARPGGMPASPSICGTSRLLLERNGYTG